MEIIWTITRQISEHLFKKKASNVQRRTTVPRRIIASGAYTFQRNKLMNKYHRYYQPRKYKENIFFSTIMMLIVMGVIFSLFGILGL